MAKKVVGHVRDEKTGKVTAVDMTATRAQKKSEKNLIPFTKAPGRIARALWH
jgi:hypothetical protein